MRSGEKVDLSLGLTEAEVDFGMKKFPGKISFQWDIAKGARANGLAAVNLLNNLFVADYANNKRNA